MDEPVEQIRVLKLVPGTRDAASKKQTYTCAVEIWLLADTGSGKSKRGKSEWKLVETRVPLRLGKPLP